MAKPRLLITRFSPQAEQLVALLAELDIFSLAQPLFELKPVINCAPPFQKSYDVIIAISHNAVDYTARCYQGENWPQSTYLAVGKSTQASLENASKQTVTIPSTEFNSEGLLALPELQHMQRCSVLILRGVGGRSLLREQLIKRGASVDYYQSYQRVALPLAKTVVDKWQQQAINGVIINSFELLAQLLTITCASQHGWLKSLTLFATSDRILTYAQELGFYQTVRLASSANQDIIDYFTHEGCYD